MIGKSVKIGEEEYEVKQIVFLDNFKNFAKHIHDQKSAAFLFFAITSIIFFLITLYFISNADTSKFTGLKTVGIGLVIAFILLPMHELIHFLAFKLVGAKKVKILSYFKNFYLLTVSDQFVIGRKNIFWIAALPFIVISFIGIILLFFVSPIWRIVMGFCLVIHTSYCLHDFQLIEYFLLNHRDEIMKTDVKNRTTYFFKRTV